MNRRVLHVVQPADGGAPAVALQYAAYQHSQGDDVHLAAGRGWVSQHVPRGVALQHWDATREPGPSTVGEAMRMRRLVRSIEPDIIHLHASKAGLAGRLAVRGRIPTVFQPHAWSWVAASGGQRQAALRWERWAARWTAAHVCVSRSELADGRRSGVRLSRPALVPNGVDIERFAPADRLHARSALDLPAHAPLVVCVGRLSRQKGQDALLRAWPDVLSRHPDALLVIVGDGPDRGALAVQAHGLHGVSFVGSRDDVARWYAACDVAVFPSRWEGMALAPLEAMASARPVVAFDVEGVSESVAPAGDDDAVVSPGDTSALAAALVRRIGAPDEAGAEGARQHRWAVSWHGADRASAAVEDLYRGLV